MESAHIHEWNDDQRCRWCNIPRLNGSWPTGTFLQRRLTQLRMAELEREIESHA